jgi:hypothetical protein
MKRCTHEACRGVLLPVGEDEREACLLCGRTAHEAQPPAVLRPVPEGGWRFTARYLANARAVCAAQEARHGKGTPRPRSY